MIPLVQSAATAVVAVATLYVALAYSIRFAMLLGGAWELRRQRRYRTGEHPEAAIASGELPSISVIVPAYNEEASIVRTVRSLLKQRYGDFEIVVVNDGSIDRTMGVLHDAFDLEPEVFFAAEDIPTQNVRMSFRSAVDERIRVIDKRNGGKADALNVGINHATASLVCVIDADVILDPLALYYLSLPFVEDPTTVASSGTIRPHNGSVIERDEVVAPGVPRSPSEALQIVEYILAFGVGRLFFNLFNAHVVISGAFGLFRRDVMVEVSGFHPQAIGEDMELVVRIHRYLRERRRPYRITFVSDALCFTEAPASMTELGKQRSRWHQGLLTTLRLHKPMIGRARYGPAGWFSLPYFLFFELLAPAAEAIGWATVIVGGSLGFVDLRSAFGFLLIVLGLSTLTTWTGLLIDDAHSRHFRKAGDLVLLAAYSLTEHFWYHQLMIYYRLRAFPRFYGGVHLKGGWVSPTRQNPSASSSASASAGG